VQSELNSGARWRVVLGAALLSVSAALSVWADDDAGRESTDVKPAAETGPTPAEAPGKESAAPEGGAKPNTLRHARRQYRYPQAAAAIDERVKLLAAELKLDATQQNGVRQVLTDEREQTRRVWADTSVPAALRIKSTQDISDRTAERIRALLNDEQRKKYIKPRPGGASPASSSDDLEKYMNDANGK